MIFFCIFALVATASASVYSAGECPEVKPVANFNLTAFGQGTWYEVARYPNLAESAGNCGFADYTLDGDVIKIRNNHVENNKLVWIDGVAELDKEANGYGKLVYVLPYGDNAAPKKSMLDILKVDYKNYAIGYHCKSDEKSHSHQDFAWILSRSKVVPFHIKSAIDRYVRESKVLDSKKFMWPDFSEGACRVEDKI